MDLLAKAERLYTNREFKELNKLLDDPLLKKNASAILYSYKARALDKIGETSLCFSFAEIAISLDPQLPYGYLARGNFWYDMNENKKAIDDYTKAIQLDKNTSVAHYNRGNTWFRMKNYKEAQKNYTKAITLGQNFAYYNRAMVYNEVGDYKNAIADYQHFLTTETRSNCHYTYVANREIEKINRIFNDEWFDQFYSCIKKIKGLLFFEGDSLTQYTGLSSASSLILEQSPFRVSEGNYLNDTSEGKELFNYLFTGENNGITDLVQKNFVEKPFVGSFVSQQHSDDLTLWRLYGKEKKEEGKGCSLVLDKRKFIRHLETTLNPVYAHSVDFPETEGNFTFYRVAYYNGKQFLIPEKDVSINRKLNDCLKILQLHLKSLKSKFSQTIKNSLEEVNYLFKSAAYQHENEIRLIIDGTTFTKKIIKDITPPRVCIELIPLENILTKLIIGPKVESPEEWAAAFNYQLNQGVNTYTGNKNLEQQIEVVISHHPFK